MSAVVLSAGQAEVLRLMQRMRHPDDPMSTPEISRRLEKRFDDWARDKLKRLAEHGLVERTGETFSRGHCWRMTLDGKAWRAPAPAGEAAGGAP